MIGHVQLSLPNMGGPIETYRPFDYRSDFAEN